MRAMRLLHRVLAGLIICIFLLPVAYCRAGEREEAAIRYFTAEPAGRYDMYFFLREKLKGEEALPEEEDSEPWVLVTPDEKFNAYALPGGIFVVNRGVLNILSDDELAVILAHELGHQVLGHPVAAMKRSPLACRYLRRAAKELAKELAAEGQAGDAEPENTELARKSVEAFWEAVQLSHVLKREEREADEWAAQLIATSGFDVYAAVNLWPWLEELYGPVPNASNHLSYKERSKIYEAAGRYVEQ